MPQSPIEAAISQICQEKNLSEESVLQTIEAALAAAFRKDFGNKMQNILAEFNPKTGGVKVFDVKTVVEDLPEDYEEQLAALAEEKEKIKSQPDAGQSQAEKSSFVTDEGEEDEDEIRRFNPKTEIQLKDAKEIDKKYKIGDEIVTPLEVPGEFGRMAAQTAKQVIIQKLREEERQNIYEEFKVLENQVINGSIQRREGRNVLVDLGHATAIMLPEDQVERERYNIGNRMKFYLRSVEQSSRGPQLIVSRSSKEIVGKIFEMEIPEIANNSIEIKSIAREAGNRSKVAIFTDDENIDPIGSCVGQRGARIQTIISELNGEKVDIILWDEDPVKFITNALSPAKIISIELKESENEEEKVALATVKEDQLSLAIGRAGQNVRLASKLTGWKIDIVSDTGKNGEDVKEVEDEKKDKAEKDEDKKEEEKEDKDEEKEKKSKAKKEKKDETEDKKEDKKSQLKAGPPLAEKLKKSKKEDKEEKEDKKDKKEEKK